MKEKLIILAVVFFILLTVWIMVTEKREKKQVQFRIKEREEKLYRKSLFCKCVRPDINDKDAFNLWRGHKLGIPCQKCGMEFTDDSILVMNNKKN